MKSRHNFIQKQTEQQLWDQGFCQLIFTNCVVLKWWCIWLVPVVGIDSTSAVCVGGRSVIEDLEFWQSGDLELQVFGGEPELSSTIVPYFFQYNLLYVQAGLANNKFLIGQALSQSIFLEFWAENLAPASLVFRMDRQLHFSFLFSWTTYISEKRDNFSFGNNWRKTNKMKRFAVCNTFVLPLSTTDKKIRLKNKKMVWESQILWISSKYLNFVWIIMCTPYLFMENELGDGKGVDRLAMPWGMFKPSISDIVYRTFVSFRSLASKGSPNGSPNEYSKSVCVRLYSQSSEPTMLFPLTTPGEHPRTPPPRNVQLSSLYPTSPSFNSFGAACVMLCCLPPASSSISLRPSVYNASISLVVNTTYIRTFFGYLNAFYIFDQTCIVLKSGRWLCGSESELQILVWSQK